MARQYKRAREHHARNHCVQTIKQWIGGSVTPGLRCGGTVGERCRLARELSRNIDSARRATTPREVIMRELYVCVSERHPTSEHARSAAPAAPPYAYVCNSEWVLVNHAASVSTSALDLFVAMWLPLHGERRSSQHRARFAAGRRRSRTFRFAPHSEAGAILSLGPDVSTRSASNAPTAATRAGSPGSIGAVSRQTSAFAGGHAREVCTPSSATWVHFARQLRSTSSTCSCGTGDCTSRSEPHAPTASITERPHALKR